jgi:mercuric ion transport protein
MSLPLRPSTHTHHPPGVDNAPPTRSKVTGGVAALACAACCAIPLLIAVGALTGAGAALLEQTLIAIAAALAVGALGMWWLHRRRSARRATAAGASRGCGNCG